MLLQNAMCEVAMLISLESWEPIGVAAAFGESGLVFVFEVECDQT